MEITAKLKKLISTLVCVMMVFGTFPVHMLNASVFAEDAVVYGAQTAAIPEIVEDIEGENAQSDELSEKQVEQGEQVAEPEKEAEEVLMEGGEVLKASKIEELQDAINKAKNGDTIQITNNIDVVGQGQYALTVKDKKITITSEEGVKTIICHDANSLLKVEGKDAGVTLENVKIDGCDVEKYGSLIEIIGGILILNEGATISRCRAFVCCIHCKDGIVNINGGEISNCIADNGGAIYCGMYATVNMSGGKISDCYAGGNGGAIFFDSIYAEFNMTGGEIFNCRANKNGGAISCEEYRVKFNMTMKGGKISNCHAEGNGGAISFGVSCLEFNMIGGEISDCSANENGGSIFFGEGIMIARGGKIFDCYAGKKGNVIYAEGAKLSLIEEKSKKLTIKKYENAKGIDSGLDQTGGYEGIYLERDDFDWPDNLVFETFPYVEKASNFEQLKTMIQNVLDGGVARIELTGDIKMTDEEGCALIVKNKKITLTSQGDAKTIKCEGIGVLLKVTGQNSSVTLENLKIENGLTKDGKKYIRSYNIWVCEGGTLNIGTGAKISNFKSDRGGAICCYEGIVNMNGGEISNCEATDDGGAIYCINGTVNMTGGKITRCYANKYGNAIYTQGRVLYGSTAKLSLIDIRSGSLHITKMQNAPGTDTDSDETGEYVGIYLGEESVFATIPVENSGNNNNAGGDNNNNAGGDNNNNAGGDNNNNAGGDNNNNAGGDNNNNAGGGNNNTAGDSEGEYGGIYDPFPNYTYDPFSSNLLMKNLFGGGNGGDMEVEDVENYGGDMQIEDAENYGDENEYDEGEYDEDYDEDYDDEYDEDKEDAEYGAENGSGSGESSKNDFWGAMLPWMIGAAVVATGAAAVVVVLKNRRGA